MIDFHLLRHLSLATPIESDRPSFLSAASGLVQQGDTLYVVADDELHLGIFPVSGSAPGRVMRLLDGELPAESEDRKRHKPDFEALTLLPPFAGYPHGALLALGSGSKERRRRGSLFALGANGELIGRARAIDASALYDGLKDEFDKPNIEGATIIGADLVLLQRGNKGQRVNATIHVELAPLLAMLADGDELTALRPRHVRHYDLGEAHGVPLCFTDGAALPGGELVFTAVAEDTEDSYHDGPCAGSAIGLIDRDGSIVRIDPLAPCYKVEGLHAWRKDRQILLLAVTDGDDPQKPAALLRAQWSPG